MWQNALEKALKWTLSQDKLFPLCIFNTTKEKSWWQYKKSDESCDESSTYKVTIDNGSDEWTPSLRIYVVDSIDAFKKTAQDPFI